MRGERGQAMALLMAAIFLLLLGTAALGSLGQGLLGRGRTQRAADLAAISAARSMRDDFPRLFVPPTLPGGLPNPLHLEKWRYLARARLAAARYARANGARLGPGDVAFPDGVSFAPTRVRVRLRGEAEVDPPGRRRRLALRGSAEARLAFAGGSFPAVTGGGGYSGPLAYRQGKPMRPDTARAFDRMAAAARHDGVSLIVVSAYRSDAEQAVLFRRHPDPRWVAPPGKSLHRLGTELDLGPSSAYGWLRRNARRFGFIQRYAWEPWHFGYTLNPRSTPDRYRDAGRPGGDGRSALPSFVPRRFAGPIARAASRYNVSASLLAAQLYAESNFNPFAVSSAGARGIAQFMPGTAASYGLRDPFDPVASIGAQARFMRDLLRRFASVPLALAAYNAGPGAVARCGCVPSIPETQAYVARILALMGGAGEAVGAGGLEVVLVG